MYKIFLQIFLLAPVNLHAYFNCIKIFFPLLKYQQCKATLTKWEGIGIPKSIIEEKNPVYRKVDPEPHPSTLTDRKEGKKEFEYVVR